MLSVCMDILTVRIVSIIAIAFVYMLFDIFNNRNVPSIFVYATLAYGAALTILYFNYAYIALSLGIAAATFGIGYAIYKIGNIGFGDISELTAISLMLPIQSVPLLASVLQLNLPFMFSIIISSGLAALVIVPLYYIPKSRRMVKSSITKLISAKQELKAMIIGITYMIFIGVLSFTGFITLYGIIILALLMFGSMFTILFEKPITESMISYVPAVHLQEEDMIAMNIVPPHLKKEMSAKIKHFAPLVSKKMLAEIKEKQIEDKLPVYRNGIPFAVPIFIGVVLSILFGNILLLAIRLL